MDGLQEKELVMRESQPHNNGAPPQSFKERMDNDINRVKLSLVNLMQRRYPDNWREKLAEFVQ